MDTRNAFLNTSRTLLFAMTEMASFRIVGNTISVATVSVHFSDKKAYEGIEVPAIAAIRKISPNEFAAFDSVYKESSIVLSYAWLDTFLSEAEEALFLHDPSTLGDNVQIKLGKVLGSSSIDELVHDIARRKTREKSQWGLKNRVAELMIKYGIRVSVEDGELDWMSQTRNNITHNRQVGAYRMGGGKVTYEGVERRRTDDHDVERFLWLVFALLAQLYVETAGALGINKRFPAHRRNLKFIDMFAHAWPEPKKP